MLRLSVFRTSKCKRMTLCCSYRPGDQSIDRFISYLDGNFHPCKVIEYRCFKNYNKEAFLHDLSIIPWSVIEGARDADDAVYLWDGLFRGVADEHAPLKTKHVKGKQSPCITAKLLEIRRDRDYHWEKAHASSSNYHWEMYRKLRNCANSEEKRLNQNIILGWLKMPRETAPRCGKQLKRRFHLITMELMQLIPERSEGNNHDANAVVSRYLEAPSGSPSRNLMFVCLSVCLAYDLVPGPSALSNDKGSITCPAVVLLILRLRLNEATIS